MNYFPLYACPIASAQALDDKRVRRSYMLGVNTLRDLGAKRTQWLDYGDTLLWFIEWVRALGDEINHRWQRLDHYEARATWLALPAHLKHASLPDDCVLLNNAKSCAKATRPADFTHLAQHEAYRNYIAYRWLNIDKRPPTWTARSRPFFSMHSDETTQRVPKGA